MSVEAPIGAPANATRTYRQPFSNGWWLRRPSYFWYMVREFSPIPMVAWWVWFLWEVYRLEHNDYEIQSVRWPFIAFSAVCLFFALYHAITFLSLSGMILRVPVGDRFIPARAIKFLALGGLVAATVVGGAVFIYLGTVTL